ARFGTDLDLRPEVARDALASLGAQLDLDPVQTATGILEIVEEVMAGAVRRVSIEQGADPRQATLVAFGGAGGLHGAALARRLDMAGVLIPAHAGLFSALGLLL
ncbi:MAG: hydantoinase/oxoprolinase family protein, partial [Akkermansiaceae bacterium]|nr:hydantoinase/oxoprolinase family protein [Akkermansiaceae bacterium]